MPLLVERPPTVPEIESLLRDIPASWQDGPFVWERRAGHRIRFTGALSLIPLDDDSDEPCGPTWRVHSRDISLRGISFAHDMPLPYRKVGLSFELPGSGPITVVTRLHWCRFTRNGVYESGGEFLRVWGETA